MQANDGSTVKTMSAHQPRHGAPVTKLWMGIDLDRDAAIRWTLYAALFLAALMLRIACFTGLINSDDIEYAYFAQLLSHGAYPIPDNHIPARFGLTVPTALVYALFGAKEFTTVLVPLLASSACVPLLVAVARRLTNWRAALIAGVLLLTFPVHVHYASVLVPEAVVDFWILIGALVYLGARTRGRMGMAVLAGVVFGVGYLAKEVALFVAAAFVLDALLQRRWLLFWGVIVGLALVGGAELLAYAITSGDPLLRMHFAGTAHLTYFANGMEEARSTWRLFKTYPYLMLVPNIDMGLHSLIALVLCVVGLRGMNSAPRRLLCLWAAVPMLYLNFGSASMSTYLPVFAGPRYVVIVYAPLFVLAGATLERWMGSIAWRQMAGVVLLTLTTGVGASFAFVTASTGYHTGEVGALRSIARQLHSNRSSVAAVEGPRAKLWVHSLRLLTPPSGVLPTDCVTVGPDAVGLPHVTSVSECAPGTPVDDDTQVKLFLIRNPPAATGFGSGMP